VSDRIEKYGEWDGALAENIDFGCKKARDVIVTFLVDDGLESRPHRKNLFHQGLKFVGVYMGPHKEWEHVTVINAVEGIRNADEEPAKANVYLADAIKRAEEHRRKEKKNSYQNDDFDAPDNTVGVNILKLNKNKKGKQVKITKKIYDLSDGSQHIVEVEEK
jgi:hypothetical protein